jgi:type II secretory pathway pseudopilin PulG
LLVVIAIIGVLVALLLPAVQAAREAARRARCMNNMRQLGVAAQLYEVTHKHFPPGIGYYDKDNPSANMDFGTWLFYLLPNLEEQNLFVRSSGSVPFPLPTGTKNGRYPGNNEVYSKPVPTFLCPSDASVEANGVVTIDGVVFGATCYVPSGLISAETDWSKNPLATDYTTNPQAKTRMKEILDGTSKTILHAEKYARCTISDPAIDPAFHEGGGAWAYLTSPLFWWLPPPMNPPAKGYQPAFAIPILKGRGAPNAIGPESLFQIRPAEGECDPTRAATAHSGMVVGLADGSVRNLAAGMSGEVWWAAVTPAWGEVQSSDW